ncbi:hypothetical protein M9434_006884 [Picochlorum sp. BPE23]|nr:hypothetical protein M9434_006884 [Picochlorum sp. BPE23]KAI8102348.1 hypothetical protein M9435_005952 [Picochlorum sp. BPE23]
MSREDEIPSSSSQETVTLKIKFKGKELSVSLSTSETVGSVKRVLERETHVNAKKQKLLGLKAVQGRLDDDTLLGDLQPPPKVVMLLGSVDSELAQMRRQEEISPCFQDPEEEDVVMPAGPVALMDRPEILAKLERRVLQANIKELHPPREGKKCIVLDIDYTFFDLGSSSERPRDLLRPHVELFLSRAYARWDIVIWSATSMKWIDVKLKELGLIDHPEFRITACMDYTAMVTVDNTGMTNKKVFDCKPLHVLWKRYPQYTSSNTLMLDDLRRNFVLNPQNGLVIKPFKHSTTERGRSDREFLKLDLYLSKLAELESLDHLNHDEWQDTIREEWREIKKK